MAAIGRKSKQILITINGRTVKTSIKENRIHSTIFKCNLKFSFPEVLLHICERKYTHTHLLSHTLYIALYTHTSWHRYSVMRQSERLDQKTSSESLLRTNKYTLQRIENSFVEHNNKSIHTRRYSANRYGILIFAVECSFMPSLFFF